MRDLWDLRIGTRLQLKSGSYAEVVAPTEDGQWILVRYTDAPKQYKELVGTQDLCYVNEIRKVLQPEPQ